MVIRICKDCDLQFDHLADYCNGCGKLLTKVRRTAAEKAECRELEAKYCKTLKNHQNIARYVIIQKNRPKDHCIFCGIPLAKFMGN